MAEWAVERRLVASPDLDWAPTGEWLPVEGGFWSVAEASVFRVACERTGDNARWNEFRVVPVLESDVEESRG